MIAIIDDLNLSRSARKSLGRGEHQIRECLPLRDRLLAVRDAVL